jgi:hypothetical protein
VQCQKLQASRDSLPLVKVMHASYWFQPNTGLRHTPIDGQKHWLVPNELRNLI